MQLKKFQETVLKKLKEKYSIPRDKDIDDMATNIQYFLAQKGYHPSKIRLIAEEMIRQIDMFNEAVKETKK